MKRFSDFGEMHHSTISGTRGLLISLAIFVITLVVFLYGVSYTVDSGVEQQKENLEEAINRSMLQCYVTEGRYPQSFDYLKEHYGIIYDDSLFRVDYVVHGTNMKPEVDVIMLEAARQ